MRSLTLIPSFAAPEVVCNEAAFPQTDIWSVGVLTYVLLSGVSPFRGENQEETRQNITFVRYRFEYLYKELTQEATRFLMLIFKRTPRLVSEEFCKLSSKLKNIFICSQQTTDS